MKNGPGRMPRAVLEAGASVGAGNDQRGPTTGLVAPDS